MAFSLLFKLLLFRVFLQTRAEVQYYVSHNKSTWDAAFNKCTLATPSINFNNEAVQIVNQDILEDIWVGYFVALMDFEILGRLLVKNNYEMSSYKGMSLGRCFSSCENANYFGKSEDGCFCFETKPKNISRDLVCDTHCKGQKFKLCMDGYMKIYQVYSNGAGNIQYINMHNLSNLCPPVSNTVLIPKEKHCVEKATAILKYDGNMATLKATKIRNYCYVSPISNRKEIRCQGLSRELKALCTRVHRAENSQKGNSNIYIGVAGAVLVIVLALAITLIIILKRRSKLPKFWSNGKLTKSKKKPVKTYKEDKSFTITYKVKAKNVKHSDITDDYSHFSSKTEEQRRAGSPINESQTSDVKNMLENVNVKSNILKKYDKVNGERGPLNNYYILQKIDNENKVPGDAGSEKVASALNNEDNFYNTLNEANMETSNNVYDSTEMKSEEHDSNITKENTDEDDDDRSPSQNYYILEKIENEPNVALSTGDFPGSGKLATALDNENDFYNTLNEASKETSDNLYDTTEMTSEKHNPSYAIIGEQCRQKGTDSYYNKVDFGDGEYSHTGGYKINTGKTDNVYGMLQGQQRKPVRPFDEGNLENSRIYNHLNIVDNVYS